MFYFSKQSTLSPTELPGSTRPVSVPSLNTKPVNKDLYYVRFLDVTNLEYQKNADVKSLPSITWLDAQIAFGIFPKEIFSYSLLNEP